MILPNTEMNRGQMAAFVATANGAYSAGKLKGGPFLLFNPSEVAGGPYGDLPRPYTVTDRGGWGPGGYNAGDMVECDGYFFISTKNANTNRPIDPPILGNATDGWRMPWYSCYQRIRDRTFNAANNITATTGLIPLTQFQQAVSGPWPCGLPNINYDQLQFHYEDTGRAEQVIFSGDTSLPVQSPTPVFQGIAVGAGNLTAEEIFTDFAGSVHTPQRTDSLTGDNPLVLTAVTGPSDSGGQYKFTYPHSVTFKVSVGGTVAIPVNLIFRLEMTAYRGCGFRNRATGSEVEFEVFSTDADDPTTLGTVSGGLGGAWTAEFSGWSGIFGSNVDLLQSGIVTFSSAVNATVAPGEYIISVAVTGGPGNAASGTLSYFDNGDGTQTTSGVNEWTFKTFVVPKTILTVKGSIGYTATNAVEVAGISDRARVLKIAAPVFNPDILAPSGILGATAFYRYHVGSQSVLAPLPEFPIVSDDQSQELPVFVEFRYATRGLLFTGISASTTGYWLGKTPPVRNLRITPFDRMPWNQFPHTFPGSGANSATENRYLGYILPYQFGKKDTNQNALQAYDSLDAPAWVGTRDDSSELTPWPRRWKALTHYPAGFTIIDSYGNLHTAQSAGRSGGGEPHWSHALDAITNEGSYNDFLGVVSSGVVWKLTKVLRRAPTVLPNTFYNEGDTVIDANGNQQTATTASTTGFITPNWATTLNATTVDGGVLWRLTHLYARLIPPVAKITPPIYPFFWHNPVSQWLPTTSYAKNDLLTDSRGNTQQALTAGTSGGSQPAWNALLNGGTPDGSVSWKTIRLEQPSLVDPNVNPLFPVGNPARNPFSFRPQGFWIYRVALNRIPQTKSTEKPPVTGIPVTLGCIRNGVFVSFGTFLTGQMVDAGWFAFTNTALAYECAERVDIQAEIVTCGSGYDIWGTVAYPMCAAFLNDIETIIGKL